MASVVGIDGIIFLKDDEEGSRFYSKYYSERFNMLKQSETLHWEKEMFKLFKESLKRLKQMSDRKFSQSVGLKCSRYPEFQGTPNPGPEANRLLRFYFGRRKWKWVSKLARGLLIQLGSAGFDELHQWGTGWSSQEHKIQLEHWDIKQGGPLHPVFEHYWRLHIRRVKFGLKRESWCKF